jgi:hypothetical protein
MLLDAKIFEVEYNFYIRELSITTYDNDHDDDHSDDDSDSDIDEEGVGVNKKERCTTRWMIKIPIQSGVLRDGVQASIKDQEEKLRIGYDGYYNIDHHMVKHQLLGLLDDCKSICCERYITKNPKLAEILKKWGVPYYLI